MQPSDPDSTVPPDSARVLSHPEPDIFAFSGGISVTITLRGTEFATISLALPGAQPFTIICAQSYALSRALYESTAQLAARTGLPEA